MTMRKQLVVSLSDLRHVCIECPLCHTKVTLDMLEKSPLAEKHNFFAPKTGCHAEYDSAIRNGIDALQDIYAPLVEHDESKITFVASYPDPPAL